MYIYTCVYTYQQLEEKSDDGVLNHTYVYIHTSTHTDMYMCHMHAYQQLEEESDEGTRLGLEQEGVALGPLLCSDGAVVVDVH